MRDIIKMATKELVSIWTYCTNISICNLIEQELNKRGVVLTAETVQRILGE